MAAPIQAGRICDLRWIVFALDLLCYPIGLPSQLNKYYKDWSLVWIYLGRRNSTKKKTANELKPRNFGPREKVAHVV